jgi:hypothetical protein
VARKPQRPTHRIPRIPGVWARAYAVREREERQIGVRSPLCPPLEGCAGLSCLSLCAARPQHSATLFLCLSCMPKDTSVIELVWETPQNFRVSSSSASLHPRLPERPAIPRAHEELVQH